MVCKHSIDFHNIWLCFCHILHFWIHQACRWYWILIKYIPRNRQNAIWRYTKYQFRNVYVFPLPLHTWFYFPSWHRKLLHIKGFPILIWCLSVIAPPPPTPPPPPPPPLLSRPPIMNSLKYNLVSAMQIFSYQLPIDHLHNWFVDYRNYKSWVRDTRCSGSIGLTHYDNQFMMVCNGAYID